MALQREPGTSVPLLEEGRRCSTEGRTAGFEHVCVLPSLSQAQQGHMAWLQRPLPCQQQDGAHVGACTMPRGALCLFYHSNVRQQCSAPILAPCACALQAAWAYHHRHFRGFARGDGHEAHRQAGPQAERGGQRGAGTYVPALQHDSPRGPQGHRAGSRLHLRHACRSGGSFVPWAMRTCGQKQTLRTIFHLVQKNYSHGCEPGNGCMAERSKALV